jgi:hypothetical protein
MIRRAGALALLVLLLAPGGCGKSRVAGPLGPGTPPPVVVEVFPAPRSVHVPYTIPEIWARFQQPLDPATVDERTVFLKRDTARLPIDASWDADSLLLRIRPLQPLELAETYTVELGAGIETTSGRSLGETYWWQFTVSGVRRLAHPQPPDGVTGESPFAPLSWDRTESSAGVVEYDLYVSADSAAVAARSIAPLVTTPQAEHYRNPTAWPRGATRYWAVTARNLTLGEREDGPVWSFTTAPPGAPTDSILIPAVRWGYLGTGNNLRCNESSLIFASAIPNLMVFDLAAARPLRRIAGARIKMILTVGTVPPASTVYSTTRALSPSSCVLSGPSAPVAQFALASNINSGTTEFSYASDPLTFQLAAMHLGLASAHGFTVQTASRSISVGTPPTVVLHYYR